MSEGPSAGDILLGLFMIAAGLCLALVGGGCTLMLLSDMRGMMRGSDGLFFFLLSAGTLAGGLAMLWFGLKIMTGRYRK